MNILTTVFATAFLVCLCLGFGAMALVPFLFHAEIEEEIEKRHDH